MQRKLTLLMLVLALAFTAGLASAQEKIIEVGITQEPDGFGTMFSMVAGTQIEAAINPTMQMLYRDDEWELHTNLALYRPNIDDGTWIVDEENETMIVHWKIRDDVYWHDGEQVTTHDFVVGHNIHMHRDYPAITKTVAGYIEEIEVINDFEMKFHYNQLYPFADGQVLGFMPKPAHIFEQYYEDDNIQGVIDHNYWRSGFFGWGPYKLEEWVSGSHIELTKNPDYIRGEPKVDTVVFRFVEDTETLRFMIETGEVQVSLPPTLGFDSAMAVQRSVDPEQIHVGIFESIVWQHIDFNTRDFEPFQDPRVRRALIQGMDRQEIMETVYEGLLEPADTMMSPRHPHFTEEAYEVITTYEYNPERAIALLSAAGFAPGPDGVMTHQETGDRLELDFRTTAGNTTRELSQQIIAEQWSEIGVKVNINNMTAPALFDPDHFYRREWPHLILFAWVSAPTSMGDTLWHMDAIPTEENNWVGQNMAGWVNEEASALFDEMLATMDEARRQELNTRILQLWTYELPSIPLFFDVDFGFWTTNITGVRPTGSNDPDTWNIHEWDIQ